MKKRDPIDEFRSFLVRDQGQDLTEYALLLAFVCLASSALFLGAESSINTIWTTANTVVNNAARCAGS